MLIEKPLAFGEYLRFRRERLARDSKLFSVRQVARRVGVEPSYLSKVERGEQAPPGEETIKKLAQELGDDPDLLLGMAGKVSSDILETIRTRPALFAGLLRQLKSLPDENIVRIASEVRDGDW